MPRLGSSKPRPTGRAAPLPGPVAAGRVVEGGEKAEERAREHLSRVQAAKREALE
eukprot:COSAG01_NODE_2347_length_7858_cov_6.577007_1_plen_54_part_10